MFRPQPLSAEQLQAIKLFGSVSVVREGVRIVEPACGAGAVRALLQIGFLRGDAEVQRVFKEAGVSKATADVFNKDKVVYRVEDEYGTRLNVLPRIPGITDDNLSEYADSEEEFGEEHFSFNQEIKDDRQLKYKLNNLFNDVTLTDKLQLSSRRLQAAKRLALSDPAAAAASLRDYLRSHGFPRVEVLAGDYAKTIGRAREYMRSLGTTFVYKDLAAPSVVTNSALHMTFDQFKGEDLWTVIGPLKYATEVQIVYQAAVRYGPDQAMFITGTESAMLGIHIEDAHTREPYSGTFTGYSSLAGIKPVDSSMPSELTAEQQTRLRAAARKVAPVYVDGAVIGSAVHVTDRHVIVNEHTLTQAADAEKVPELCGLPVHESRSVAGDIAMVRRDGVAAQWLLREADVGERVVLCFSVGENVEYSEVLRIQASYGGQLILSDSNVLRKGASGAAVVALRDSALLGIFYTKRASSVICASFSSTDFSKVTDFMSVTSSEYVGTPSTDVGTQTYRRMMRKGLQSFVDGISDATVGLYTSQMGRMVPAGMAADVSGTWFTTVDPDISQLMLRDGTKLRFSSAGEGLYTVTQPPPILKPLPNIRSAEPGERVFIFAKEGADIFMTAVRIVTHAHADNRRFVVEDFGDSEINLVGGLIVAERDAAVLGQFQSRVHDAFGNPSVLCLPLHARPVLAVGVPATGLAVDSKDIVREMDDWLASDSVVAQMADFGKTLISVVGKQAAYKRATSIGDGAALALSNWSSSFDKIVERLGWDPGDWIRFERHGRLPVAECYIALTYLRDPGGFFDKTVTWLVDGYEPTPVVTVGEFPFPRSGGPFDFIERPASTSSVNSALTYTAESRVRDLEARFEMLARMVDKRVSTVSQDSEKKPE